MSNVKIYTTSYCPYCSAAKNLFKSKGVDFEEVDVEGDQAMRQWLIEVTGMTTVPQIFIADKPYGGFTDVQALNQSGELDRLLAR